MEQLLGQTIGRTGNGPDILVRAVDEVHLEFFTEVALGTEDVDLLLSRMVRQVDVAAGEALSEQLCLLHARLPCRNRPEEARLGGHALICRHPRRYKRTIGEAAGKAPD